MIMDNNKTAVGDRPSKPEEQRPRTRFLGPGVRHVFRFHGVRVDRALHNLIYFAFYDAYVPAFVKLGRFLADHFGHTRLVHRMYDMVYSRYHSKVITPQEFTKILTLNHNVALGPDTSKKIIPFKYANNIILEEPEYIAVMDCPCRLSRENPCQPLNVCMGVGRLFAELWMDVGEKYHVRRVTQAEALQILKDARSRGAITAAWLKVATGARTGVICSCCSCCCRGLEGMRIAKRLTGGAPLTNVAPSGYRVVIDEDRCIHCQNCSDMCKFEAMRRSADGARLYDAAACLGCGLCVENCRGGALRLEIDAAKGLPLDLDLARATLLRGNPTSHA
jgi:Pyruvate/2-oxoacid:ferredoxin oxidoreductase delta subunit